MTDETEHSDARRQQAVSTELTGAGFTAEDRVVAYYLAARLREEGAAPLSGYVSSVAVQQAGHGHPMDDAVIQFRNAAGSDVALGLQLKTRSYLSKQH